MATNETRLLVLSLVMMFEPINGYQIRRQLLAWRADEWAHVQPGSIYSALNTLEKHGYLSRHQVQDGGREVALYTLTPSGVEEHDRLIGDALATLDHTHLLGLFTAVNLGVTATRDMFTECLQKRLERRRAHRATRAETRPSDVSSGMSRSFALEDALADAEEAWLEETLALLAEGGMRFRDDGLVWRAADVANAQEALTDTARYRELVGSTVPVAGAFPTYREGMPTAE